MMERSTPNISYQAWRRDPKTGPPQYRSRTVYEDTSPEMVRDFFWDEEFRLKWVDFLLVFFFYLMIFDREYIIGRRIWESGRTYYCVTKPNQRETASQLHAKLFSVFAMAQINSKFSASGDDSLELEESPSKVWTISRHLAEVAFLRCSFWVGPLHLLALLIEGS
ncbi:polyketide cyclase/dehydrase and lipid transportsuperfamily protein [Striga asiatica]|uniref:Polyketide cyclase/dehydrase and lipid transportsuperfamily protein n=1 Tax=Striga asiatica TaxID=4170 RepID=A0A5A7NYV5_STRAF|nr:polyketide cyclase/dehydrase and lipid transportsuperfamily protein [Striga asiatica]